MINSSTKYTSTSDILRGVLKSFMVVDCSCLEYDFKGLLADHARIARLFSNLLGNALKYGANTQPVKVNAVTTPDRFELSVSNAGKKIAPELLESLVKPFSRGEGQEDKPGLGLGLYIANGIALAQKGTITVQSTDEQTCFVFSMPAV